MNCNTTHYRANSSSVPGDPTSGGVACWGRNPFGQLGDGTLARRFDPVDVQGLNSNVTSIAAGTLYTCAVHSGGAKCWGRNGDRQLGDNTNFDRPVPGDVTGLTSGVAKVSASGALSCALTTGGGAKCWGQNQNGGVGNGTSGGSFGLPADVTGLTTGVAALSAGADHACAVTTGGGAKCWGQNTYGQVGDGSTTNRLTQVDVSGLTAGVASIAAVGSLSCALTTGGGVMCWGRNNYGQLGDGSTTDRPTPANVTGLTSGVTAITMGGGYACALTSGGGVKCWGYNADGELGDGTTTHRNVPVDVAGLTSGVTGIFAGEQHMCAIVTGGAVKCWGYNSDGQLGDLTTTNRLLPVSVAGLTGPATAIAGGLTHTCALLSTGGMKCWGANGVGQLGDGTAAFRTVPAPVLTFNTAIVPATSMMKSHALALDATGKVFAWGSDSHGQLGQGRAINRSTPAQVGEIPTAVSHVSISQHVLAIDAFGQVWSWGENACGQLGPREAVVTSRPARVIGAGKMTKVASGGCFSLALRADGTVWGWGTIPGQGTDTSFRQIPGLSGITDIVAGTSHALALQGQNLASPVYALGDNSLGQLGQGTVGAAQGAVPVSGLGAITSIAAGINGSAAITAGGVLYSWGQRPEGTTFATPTALLSVGNPASVSISGTEIVVALGNQTVQRYTTAALGWQSVAGYTGITSVRAGNGFNLGIGAGGQVSASGNNFAGQLGLGDTAPHPGVNPIAGMTNVTMIVSGAANPSVIARKSDGTLWFWGADTLGESGDGSAVGSSVPRAVTIPVAIRQVSVGERFSAALDINGDVWGWGDNGGAALTGSFVNSSAPARIPGVSNIQAIAAGGPGVMLFLQTDGTVLRSGSLIPGAVNDGAAGVSGLSNIVAIAAGTSGYALAANNTLYAFGANASGELGNGNTSTSTTPVVVTGITGTITGVSAAAGRAGAVTSDGKAWSWGAAPLGNGSASGSSTAVQVSGITDAAELSVGALGSMVRRTGGGLLAWGDLSLDDGAAVSKLSPYAVAFHEPVKSAQLGRGNALGHLIGNTGLGWGFGNYPSISTTNASIGDGTYVRRTRPVVLLAAGGAGNIDTNDWYFDFVPASAETVPAASTPKMLGVSQLFGSDAGLAFDATIKYRSSHFGRPVKNYVFALVPAEFFNQVKHQLLGIKNPAKLEAARKNGTFVLAQLTPAGWTDVNGQLIAYSTGTANAAGGAANILNGIPSSAIAGGRFCIGYGESGDSMLTFQALREVLLLPGASQNTSGVPCVLSGVYVDGPPGSRVNTAVTFKASVVGLGPTGSVQFRDGAASLQAPVTLNVDNQSVASASITTSALTLGTHSIGASYPGDGQNAATATEIPLLHEVVSAATTVSVSGPSATNLGSPVVLTATVIGNNPTGSVQFKDGGSNLESPAPLVGGQAVLRTSALAAGDRTITAAYSGDGAGNAASTSPAFAIRVNSAVITSVELTSSAPTTPSGTAVTLTATVTGATGLTGSVAFRDGGALIATVPLAGTTATYTGTFSAGLHPITASYSGDLNNASSTSLTLFQEVTQVPVFLSISASTTGAGAGTITSNPAGVSCPGTCAGNYLSGTSVTLTATPAVGSVFVSWGGACTGTGTCTLAMDAARTVSARFELAATGTTLAPTSLAFGGQSMRTTSPGRTVTLSNASGAAISVSAIVVPAGFGASHNCTNVANNANCTITVTFTPVAEGAAAGNVAVQYDQGGSTRASVIAVTGTGEKTLVTHYYRSILRRDPDTGGKNFWSAEAARAQALGINVNEVWFAMAQAFYFSAEYAAQNRNNTGYITDLYNTFFNRAPDAAGLNFWVTNLTGGMPREVALAEFMFSAEFRNFTQAIFGNTQVRAEIDVVVDFYRGVLSRLPDDSGFNFWLGRFRTAQCQGQAAVIAQVEAISQAFTDSGEYAGRARANPQYVGDLYNGFLRRGGDLGGVLFWISTLTRTTPPPINRDQLRQEFKNSPEFQGRVNAVIAQGCMQ